MGFREVEEQLLNEMRERRDILDQAIERLEEEMKLPPYESHLDLEAIQFEAEHDMVQLDLWAQEREAGDAH